MQIINNTPKIGRPVPDQEKAAGLLKPLLDVDAIEENDKLDTAGSVFVIHVGVGATELDVEVVTNTAGVLTATLTVAVGVSNSSSGSQPRHDRPLLGP